MLSRNQINLKIKSEFNFEVLPPLLRLRAQQLAEELPFNQMTLTSQTILIVRKSPLYRLIDTISTANQCLFFRWSQSLFYRVKDDNQITNSKNGRPTKLTNENEIQLTRWLDDRIAHKDYQTKREFKEKCHYFLDKQKNDQSFSKNYYDELPPIMKWGFPNQSSLTELSWKEFHRSLFQDSPWC